jgi:hypothetical protein
MTLRRWLCLILGVVALALAVVTATLARGTADAATRFRERHAVWQRSTVPGKSHVPGAATRAGEALLGIRTRSEVLRAYQDYRAGLADVIPGTTYPQARARFEVVQRLSRLRTSLDPADRASVDVVLGVVLADGSAGAGQQRQKQLELALAAFGRAARGDPADATAKLDLEILLRATATRSKQDASASGTPGKKRQKDANPRNPTAPAREEGSGF